MLFLKVFERRFDIENWVLYFVENLYLEIVAGKEIHVSKCVPYIQHKAEWNEEFQLHQIKSKEDILIIRFVFFFNFWSNLD